MLIEYFIKSTPGEPNTSHDQPLYRGQSGRSVWLEDLDLSFRGYSSVALAERKMSTTNADKRYWTHEVVQRAIIVSELEPVDE